MPAYSWKEYLIMYIFSESQINGLSKKCPGKKKKLVRGDFEAF